MTLKAITIMQPWASLIALGHKRIETRSWHSYHRGPIAIHAGRGKAGMPLAGEEPFASVLPQGDLPVGAVIAVADLVSVLRIDESYLLPEEPELSFGDFTRGRYAWQLANIRRLKRPVPTNGYLWLWGVELPDGAL